MKIKVAKKRILKVLESDKPTLVKYKKIRQLMVPRAEKDLKTRVKKTLPVIKTIYNDAGARELAGGLDLEKTADFITFLENAGK